MAVQARAEVGLKLLRLWSDSTPRPDREGRRDYLDRGRARHTNATCRRNLPHGDQRKLEVGLLLALEPEVFMFDEPTAGMSVDEVPVILDLIKRIKARGDKCILLVEHKMDVVRSLADRIVVLHNGTLVADGAPAEVIRIAGGAGGLDRLRRGTDWIRRGCMMNSSVQPLLALGGRAHPHRAVSHPAGRRPDGAARRAHHAARPQRRRQDHHAAHHHGPLARFTRRAPVRRARYHPGGDAGHILRSASPTCRRTWASSPT
jgi:hypothetical protein